MAAKKTKNQKSADSRRGGLKPEIISIITIGVCILVIISVFSGNGKVNTSFSENAIGFLGGVVCWILKGSFGIGAYILPFGIIGFCSSAFFSETKKIKLSKFIMAVVLFLILISFTHIIGGNDAKTAAECFKEGSAWGGGFIGSIVGDIMLGIFGKIGTCVIFAVLAIILAVLITGKSFMDFSRGVYLKIKCLFEKDKFFDNGDYEEEYSERPAKRDFDDGSDEKKNHKIKKNWAGQKNKNDLYNKRQYLGKRVVKKDGKIISVNIPEKKSGQDKVRISLFTDEINKKRNYVPSFLSKKESDGYGGQTSGGIEKTSDCGNSFEASSEDISDNEMFEDDLIINGMNSVDYQAEYLKSLELQEKIIENFKERYKEEKTTPYVFDLKNYERDESDKDDDDYNKKENYDGDINEVMLNESDMNHLENDTEGENIQVDNAFNFNDGEYDAADGEAGGSDEKLSDDFFETELKGVISDEYDEDENVKKAMADYFGGNIGISVKIDKSIYKDNFNEESYGNIDKNNINKNNVNKNDIVESGEEDSYNKAHSDYEISRRVRENEREADTIDDYSEKREQREIFSKPIFIDLKKPSEKRTDEEEPKILQAGKQVLMEKNSAQDEIPKKEYVFPPVSFLDKNPVIQSQSSREEILENSRILVKTLKSFNVDAKVNEISKGPTVTRYELSPGEGIKVSKILGLADNLAMSLAAKSIRIEAPIPGKAAVGIEIPNKEVTSVYLSEVIRDRNFQDFKSKLAFGLGKDITGNVIVADIAKMPHMLIAGRTGSGKSVCINTLITSILYKSSPDDVKLIMVDPKVVELSVYNGIPHLLIPVVTDPQKAAGALNWAVSEMMARYDLFAKTGSRNLKGYNGYCEENGIDKVPQIIIIIDELADLMMVASKDVEAAICRLAQLARAAGIHLIIATQRPSVDVITGLIKANIPSRIAFAVSSATDSRTILDMGGADKLLGMGDMLFKSVSIDSDKPLRIQGAFISDKEVERIVNFIKERNPVVYDESLIEKITSTTSSGEKGTSDEDSDGGDELIDEAIAFIVKKGSASGSMLQRRFKIGYNRAARIIEELEERGIVGPETGTSKPRAVLMDRYEYEDYMERRRDYI